MKRQDKSLHDAAITIQVSTAGTLKTVADRKNAVVVVEEHPMNRALHDVVNPEYKYDDKNLETDIYVSSKEVVTVVNHNSMNKLIKIFSVKKSHLTEDLAELGNKMKLPRAPDVSLVDVENLTAQVCMAKPKSCKNKRTQKGECCCEQHCLL